MSESDRKVAPTDEQRCLRDQINETLDDIQALVLQLGAIATLPKSKRQHAGSSELHSLTQLLLHKHTLLKSQIEAGSQFARRQALIERLEGEVHRRQQCIHNVTDTLKEAEGVLITTLFQGNQKLKSIRQAEQNRIELNELMQLTHRISRTNAVAAPHNWKQGDPDRPYPTDGEMRQGVLAEMGKEAAMQSATFMMQQHTHAAHMYPMHRGMSPGMPQSQHLPSPTAMSAPVMMNRPHVSPRSAHMMAPPSPFQGVPPSQRMPFGGQQGQALPPFLGSGARVSTPFPAAGAAVGSPSAQIPPPPYNQATAGMRPSNLPWIPGTSGGPQRPQFPAVGPPMTPRPNQAAGMRNMGPYGTGQQVGTPGPSRPGMSPSLARSMSSASGFPQAQPSPSARRMNTSGSGVAASSTPPMRVDSVPASVKAPDVEVMTSDSSSSSSSDSEGK